MLKLIVAMLTLVCVMGSAAQAQMTVDVAKITCEQFRSYAITDPNDIAIWLSGYYNGQRQNTVVDVQAFKDNLNKLKDYCVTRPRMTVMQAAKEAIIDKAH